jgi:hypothetical protein
MANKKITNNTLFIFFDFVFLEQGHFDRSNRGSGAYVEDYCPRLQTTAVQPGIQRTNAEPNIGLSQQRKQTVWTEQMRRRRGDEAQIHSACGTRQVSK